MVALGAPSAVFPYFPFAVAFIPIMGVVALAVLRQFARSGRHRSVYQFKNGLRETVVLAEIVHEAKVYGICADFDGPTMGKAYITITPNAGVLSIPALDDMSPPVAT